MIGFIVTGHGNFASGITSAVTLVTGIEDGVIACDFNDMSSFESIRTKLEKAVEDLKDYDDIVIFCDLLSGTPFNQALDMKVSSGTDRIHIVYGSNLPLLIEAILAGTNGADMDRINEIVEMAKTSIGKVEDRNVSDEDDF